MEIFWQTIAAYNSATWIWQAVIILAGIAATAALVLRPNPATKIIMKLYMVILYLWIAIVYYGIWCAPRNYSNIMIIMWSVMALAWVWDAANGQTPFEKDKRYSVLAYIMLFMPFVYPMLSIARGMTFPTMTSPVMPCSVVTFTIGLMLLHSRKANLFIVLLLCHWAFIGLSKTYLYGIPEDFLMAAISIPAVYIFLKDRFIPSAKENTKPSPAILKGLLMTVSLCMGAILIYTIFRITEM